MAKVTMRYWAAAREAAGQAEQEVSADTLAAALDSVVAERAPDTRLRDVLTRSSFLLDGDQVRRADHPYTRLTDGSVVEVLPPFAGG
jgi:molybdopterin synthase sulfur carrier subunit